MIISDLQHIESATETKVQGGWDRPKPKPGGWGGYELPGDSVYSLPYNAAGAEAGAEAFGSSTIYLHYDRYFSNSRTI